MFFRLGCSTSLLYFVTATVLMGPSAHAESAAGVAAKTQAAIDAGSSPKWWTPNLPEAVQLDVDRKAQRLATKLVLGDSDREQQVVAWITEHYARVWAWHQAVDEQLDAAWAAWDEARDNTAGKEKDELHALAIMTERIDPIYAEFRPQIQRFLSMLYQGIGEEKTTVLLDEITKSPGAERTYKAYLSMIPEMTEAEKGILWGRMVQAREDSLAAWSDKRIVKIFKKYKVRNEFSIDYFGYGYRKRYQSWVKSQP